MVLLVLLCSATYKLTKFVMCAGPLPTNSTKLYNREQNCKVFTSYSIQSQTGELVRVWKDQLILNYLCTRAKVQNVLQCIYRTIPMWPAACRPHVHQWHNNRSGKEPCRPLALDRQHRVL